MVNVITGCGHLFHCANSSRNESVSINNFTGVWLNKVPQNQSSPNCT